MLLLTILTAAVLGAPMPERGSMRAEVAVESFGAGSVAVYVDSNRDNSFDHFFLLQVEQQEDRVIEAGVRRDRETDAPRAESAANPMELAPLYFKDAAVDFEPGYVRISAGSDAIELFVEGNQVPAWNPLGARVWRRAGFGLAHEIAESGIAIKREGRKHGITAEYCDATSSCDPGDTDGGTGGQTGGGSGATLCDAGGPGSTNCSVTVNGQGCTAACGTGYYACCMYGTPSKCRCIRG
jgi:hypothetical protein